MRYASIRRLDITNGIGIGCSLFVQGCPHHCYQCFNQETWDFTGGYEWTNKEEEALYEYLNKPWITRFTLIGGEPLAPQNYDESLRLLRRIKLRFPDINIWVYTGYEWESISESNIMNYIDVLVDGRYEHEKRNLSLRFRGSSNQRLIDVKQTLDKDEIIGLNLEDKDE